MNLNLRDDDVVCLFIFLLMMRVILFSVLACKVYKKNINYHATCISMRTKHTDQEVNHMRLKINHVDATDS